MGSTINEEWKHWLGTYYVSSLGRLKTTNYNNTGTTRVLCLSRNPNGYVYYHSSSRAYRWHRVVAELFVVNPDPDNRTQVNHIDGNKHNNAAVNLEWVSQSENQRHAFRNGLQERKYAVTTSDQELIRKLYERHGGQLAHGKDKRGLSSFCQRFFGVSKPTVRRILEVDQCK